MQEEQTVAQILAAEGMAEYAQDLRQLSAEELRRRFAFARSGKVNVTRVIKNLIWQAYTAICDGRRTPIAGNLRTMLRDVAAVGADEYIAGGKTTGSLLVSRMTVAGS